MPGMLVCVSTWALMLCMYVYGQISSPCVCKMSRTLFIVIKWLLAPGEKARIHPLTERPETEAEWRLWKEVVRRQSLRNSKASLSCRDGSLFLNFSSHLNEFSHLFLHCLEWKVYLSFHYPLHSSRPSDFRNV